MTTYITLPFEIHDIIMSELCKTGTYKDIIEYGLSSKYHYELMKQNIVFKNVKQTMRFLPVTRYDKGKIYKGYHLCKNGNCTSILIRRGIHLLDGIWINNSSGNLTSAEFTCNDVCIERIENIKLNNTNNWIPFSFSKYHGFNGFPILPLVYVEFIIKLTFEKPQLDTLEICIHGKDIPHNKKEYMDSFKPFKFHYPYQSQEIFVQGGRFSIN